MKETSPEYFRESVGRWRKTIAAAPLQWYTAGDMLPQPLGFTRRKIVKVCSLLALSSAWSQRLMAEERKEAGHTDSPSSADGRLHHILRIYLPLEVAPQRTAEVLDYAARTGCSEILLFTTSYDRAPSFQSLEDTVAYVEAIAPLAAKLRDAGLTVSVNVLQTLGHVYFPASMEKEFPFQRRIYTTMRRMA